jgi:predicted dehydrogenase
MKKVSWGVLGTANIALKKVIPAMQSGAFCSIDAIASRSLDQARNAAESLRIPKAYGSYEDLLEDPQIEAVYVPLPNHLHVPWIIKSLAAGKHVLCEKPISMNLQEAAFLSEEIKKYPELKVAEAFAYKHHPQWLKVQQLLKEGVIGDMVTMHTHFSYDQRDPRNVRNQVAFGGGGLLDVGCYAISLARLLFSEEPIRVKGLMEFDPQFNVDRVASGMLRFEKGSATFTCGTQMDRYQCVQIYGTKGRIAILDPFGPPGLETEVKVFQGEQMEAITFEKANAYTPQGDAFSEAIRTNGRLTPLTDALANMSVIDRLLNAAI